MKCIEDMIIAIQANPKITVTRSLMDFIDLDKTTEKFYGEYMQLRPLGKLWTVMQGCRIVWQYNSESENDLPGGEFSIDDLDDALKYESTNKEKMLSENPDFHRQDSLLNIGDAQWAGNHRNVVIQIVHATQTTQMWLYPKESYWIKLDLNFEQYVQAMCYFMCIYSWEYFFVNEAYVSIAGEALIRAACAEQERILKYLFPELDVKRRFF